VLGQARLASGLQLVLLLGWLSRAKPPPLLKGDFYRQRNLLFVRGRARKLLTADTRQYYSWDDPQHAPQPQLPQIVFGKRGKITLKLWN
jgi:hypothetical protein